VTASYLEGAGLPGLTEALTGSPTIATEFSTSVATLAHCKTLSFAINSQRVRMTITQLSAPKVGATAAAFAMDFDVSGLTLGIDIVLFRVDDIAGELIFTAQGSPSISTVVNFADEAVDKVEGKAVKSPVTASIVTAPVKLAHTSLGTVGYREIGSGPPLVMIMGFAGTMATWDPRLVDALAERYEVVVFDNAGIGKTSPVRGRLTIDAMANQTGALIEALGLKRPLVLGWSMGTMIAQALVVLHPTQVSRLVLAAAYPGTGSIKPSQAAIDALTSNDGAKALADLFPADQASAAEAYSVAISSYPSTSPAPASVVTAQRSAITSWWQGTDKAGKQTDEITAPTLVADGTDDRLDTTANDHRVASFIKGAQLVLYPDAGHAFLFQDEATFASKIEKFASG
jgi:pimeloyl-ACP methyl ester carboxylesterase